MDVAKLDDICTDRDRLQVLERVKVPALQVAGTVHLSHVAVGVKAAAGGCLSVRGRNLAREEAATRYVRSLRAVLNR